MPLPDTIQAIVNQIRAYGLGSAFIQNGVDMKSLAYSCPEQEGECRPSQPSKYTEKGGVEFQVGLQFRANGGNQRLVFTVSYEANDTYTVYFVKHLRGGAMTLIESADDVYCDNLNEILVAMYDRWVANR